MTDEELLELEKRDPRAAQIEALCMVFRCSRECAEAMWERANTRDMTAERSVRGGDWENIGEGYFAATFSTDLPPDTTDGMGFRVFISSKT